MSCDLLTKCRTCLSDSHIFHQLYDYGDENYKILEMLDGIVPQIDIKTSSNYSSLVCQSCVDKLVSGYKFQQLCIETNKRLHDLMRLSLFETVPKLEKILDPLTEASFKTKIDVEDDACFECEINPEELEETSDNDNDVGPGHNTDNDTDSSNEKLSVLKERKAHQSSSKSDDGEGPSKNNCRKGQFPCSESEDDVETLKRLKNGTELDMEKVSTHVVKEETKLTPQIFADRMEELGVNAECFNNDYDDSDDNSEKKAFTKPGAKRIKNIDFIDTGKSKDGRPNKVNGNFPCEVCGNVYSSSSSLKRHSSVHSITRPEGFKCPYCARSFAKQVSLLAHCIIHSRDEAEANYPCMVCQRNFMSAKSLTKLITNKHPEVEKHKCDHCDKTFVLHAHLMKHLNIYKGNTNLNKHKVIESLVCKTRDKEFGNTNSLKHRKRTHRVKASFLCTECGKTFGKAAILRLHMDRHKDLRNYQCPECPIRFNSPYDLKKHKLTHTNVKPYVCDLCSSRFTRICSLRRHKQLHSEERPFKCDQCSKKYSCMSHLRRHMIIHTGEKPHKCKFCGRAYKRSWYLTSHLRTHVGENTYICDQCPMAFKTHLEWKQHQSEHYKMVKKLAQSHQPEHNDNQQIIIADENQHITIEISNHQQISVVDHHSQQLPTIVEHTSGPVSESRTQSRK